MNGILMFLAIVLSIAILVFAPPLSTPHMSGMGLIDPLTIADYARALVFCYVLAAVAGFLIRRAQTHGSYLFKLFAFALLLRIVIGTAIFVFNGQDFFGGLESLKSRCQVTLYIIGCVGMAGINEGRLAATQVGSQPGLGWTFR